MHWISGFWKWANLGNVTILEMVKKVGNLKKSVKSKLFLGIDLVGKISCVQTFHGFQVC